MNRLHAIIQYGPQFPRALRERNPSSQIEKNASASEKLIWAIRTGTNAAGGDSRCPDR